jgi:oligopeptide transport system permease protein
MTSKIFRRKRNIVCLAILFILLSLCLGADRFASQSYSMPSAHRVLLSPNAINWMGTDGLGRDLFSRLLHGGQISLTVALLTALISTLIGAIYGGISGLAGGRVDRMMMKGIELIMSIPTLLLMILISVFLQESAWLATSHWRSLIGLTVALIVVNWMQPARLVRGQILSLKSEDFIEAAQAMGASPQRILFRHLMPNLAGPLLVLLAFHIPGNILYESFLSFIGLGVQSPQTSWGLLVAEGWAELRYHPHLILFPALFLTATTVSFNLLGDGLSDVLQSRPDEM